MSVFLVTYDLNQPGQSYAPLLEQIKQFSGWAKLSESSYAVFSELGAEQILAKLKAVAMDENDTIYVVSLGRPFAGFGPSDVNAWLESNLV